MQESGGALRGGSACVDETVEVGIAVSVLTLCPLDDLDINARPRTK